MLLLTILMAVLAQTDSKCSNPPPAAGFQLKSYLGVWYEIAKYQTAGGAFFEKDCTCTTIDVGQAQGKIYADQTCIKHGK